MPYHIFRPAVDTQETGPIYPQVCKMTPGYNYKALNSVHALSREVDELPSYLPNLDSFLVDGRAKPTDLLSVSVIYGGFLVSKKLKDIFQGVCLLVHKFYPAKVLYKKKDFEYFWMHIICNWTDSVDYHKSKFFIYHNYTYNIGTIEIHSKIDLMQKDRELKQTNPGKSICIWSESIKLDHNFDKKLDLFRIGNFDSNIYISENLNNLLVNNRVTGFSNKVANKIATE